MGQLSSPEFLELQELLAGRFSLERELGRGGMGIVFLARDVALDRPVAIKLLPIALAAQPDLRERFLREARTAAKLSHPNIVPIHIVEAHGTLVFFVMTFVDGETLGQRVRRALLRGTQRAIHHDAAEQGSKAQLNNVPQQCSCFAAAASAAWLGGGFEIMA